MKAVEEVYKKKTLF